MWMHSREKNIIYVTKKVKKTEQPTYKMEF